MAAYEILLLNTAIPQIQAAQSGDTYVVPRDIAFSAALTLSAGTANGVPYLSSPGKVLTTGSALTFDGNALNITVSSGNAYSVLTGASTLGAYTNYKNATADHYIGANNNFASLFGGVGGANSLALTTYGNLPIGFGINSSEVMRLTSTGLKASIAGTNADPVFSYTSDTNTGIFFPAADKLGFTAGGGSDQMVLTSTGLGIGTSSPTDTNGFGRVVDIQSNSGGQVVIRDSDDTTKFARLAFDGGTTNVAYVGAEGSGTSVLFRAGGTTCATLDSSGNLGLGVTPSAWFSTSRVYQFGSGGALEGRTNESQYLALTANQYIDSAGARKYIGSTFASLYQQYNGNHEWFTAPSGFGYGTAATSLTATQNGNSYTIVTAGTTDFTLIGAADNNVGTTFTKSGGTGAGTGTVSQNIAFTTAMTLDANGKLLLGVTSSTGLSNSDFAMVNGGSIRFRNAANSAYLNMINVDSSNNLNFGLGGVPTAITFGISGIGETARITSGGYFKASDTGSYIDPATFHEFTQTANSEGLQVRATNASYSNNVLQVRASRNTTNNSYYLISCYNDGGANYRLRVADSGDVTNVNGTYGTISDAKMKTDIVDAGSQWSDIKALRFRKFKMKDDPSGLVQLGVVAQEVEQTSPGLVDEHADRDAEGNDLGTTTKSVKTSVLLMKAAVALQEAMARIEKLEAEVATLKGA